MCVYGGSVELFMEGLGERDVCAVCCMRKAHGKLILQIKSMGHCLCLWVFVCVVCVCVCYMYMIPSLLITLTLFPQVNGTVHYYKRREEWRKFTSWWPPTHQIACIIRSLPTFCSYWKSLWCILSERYWWFGTLNVLFGQLGTVDSAVKDFCCFGNYKS